MTLITQAVMVRATIDVNRMNAQQKVQLADEIFAQQPNLLASVLVLPRFGVDTLQLEAPIHVLLVTLPCKSARLSRSLPDRRSAMRGQPGKGLPPGS
jgi:hypothetical protein